MGGDHNKEEVRGIVKLQQSLQDLGLVDNGGETVCKDRQLRHKQQSAMWQHEVEGRGQGTSIK